jgi:hypothetical protein
MPGMDEETPESAAPGEENGVATIFTPLQRLLAGFALAALLASAGISSWWILTGQVDFVDALGGRSHAAESAPEARTAVGH